MTPGGKPEVQAKDTAAVKPYSGVTTTGVESLNPGLAKRVEDGAKVKSGGAVVVKAAEATALFW